MGKKKGNNRPKQIEIPVENTDNNPNVDEKSNDISIEDFAIVRVEEPIIGLQALQEILEKSYSLTSNETISEYSAEGTTDGEVRTLLEDETSSQENLTNNILEKEELVLHNHDTELFSTNLVENTSKEIELDVTTELIVEQKQSEVEVANISKENEKVMDIKQEKPIEISLESNIEVVLEDKKLEISEEQKDKKCKPSKCAIL